MERPKKRFNVFKRIESVKDMLQVVVPDRNSMKIRALVMRCAKFRTKLIKKLNKEEARAYDILLKNNLNPKTVYRWLLLENVPSDLRKKLEQNKITIEDARKQYVRWTRHSYDLMGEELMVDIKEIVRRLRWKSQEDLQI